MRMYVLVMAWLYVLIVYRWTLNKTPGGHWQHVLCHSVHTALVTAVCRSTEALACDKQQNQLSFSVLLRLDVTGLSSDVIGCPL